MPCDLVLDGRLGVRQEAAAQRPGELAEPEVEARGLDARAAGCGTGRSGSTRRRSPAQALGGQNAGPRGARSGCASAPGGGFGRAHRLSVGTQHGACDAHRRGRLRARSDPRLAPLRHVSARAGRIRATRRRAPPQTSRAPARDRAGRVVLLVVGGGLLAVRLAWPTAAIEPTRRRSRRSRWRRSASTSRASRCATPTGAGRGALRRDEIWPDRASSPPGERVQVRATVRRASWVVVARRRHRDVETTLDDAARRRARDAPPPRAARPSCSASAAARASSGSSCRATSEQQLRFGKPRARFATGVLATGPNRFGDAHRRGGGPAVGAALGSGQGELVPVGRRGSRRSSSRRPGR